MDNEGNVATMLSGWLWYRSSDLTGSVTIPKLCLSFIVLLVLYCTSITLNLIVILSVA